MSNKIEYEKILNKNQLSAVTAPDGPILVIAGAGSGKTRTLIYRVAWLVEQGISPEEILLLTFTRKTAREMLERGGGSDEWQMQICVRRDISFSRQANFKRKGGTNWFLAIFYNYG